MQEAETNRRYQQSTIVLVSASQEVAQSTMDTGDNDFIAKPFEMLALLQKLKKKSR